MHTSRRRTRSIHRFLPFAVAAALASCAVPVQRREPQPLGSEHVVERRWEAGKLQSFLPGETVATYLEGTRVALSEASMRAPESFTARGDGVLIEGLRGQTFPVVGSTRVNGRDYRVVDVLDNTGRHLSLLLEPDGRISDRVLDGMKLLTDRFQVVPLGMSLQVIDALEYDPYAPFAHRQLVFSGVVDGNLLLLDRFFGSQSEGKPVREVVHRIPAQAGEVDLEGWKLRIERVSNDLLECAVIGESFSAS